MKSPPANRPRRTLQARLLVILLAPLAVLLLVSLAADYRIAFDPAQEAYDHALLDDAAALASRVRVQADGLAVDLPPTVEAMLRVDNVDTEFLVVVGPDGQILAGDADLVPDPVPAEQSPRLSDGVVNGQRIRKASYAMQTPQGIVRIAVAETVRKRERAGSKILAAMIVPNVLLIVATLLLVVIGIRSGLAPLTHLGRQIASRAPNDLSPLPDADAPREAEPLLDAINGLIGDLRAAAGAQQAFLANAAHQLQTPLAALQTQLEIAAGELPASQQGRVGRLLDATRRLGHLAHQLLALARSGPEANLAHEYRPVRLAELMERNVSAWVDLALGRQIDLGFEAEDAVVLGSEWLLRELLANLIDNALQYTAAGGQVTARTGTGEDGRPYIEVEDSGPGIPKHERNRIFERFYRPEHSRGTGSGLGLAIVHEVAERHGAMIDLDSGDGGRGTRIRINFPPLPRA